jgi:hypothetical protein
VAGRRREGRLGGRVVFGDEVEDLCLLRLHLVSANEDRRVKCKMLGHTD